MVNIPRQCDDNVSDVSLDIFDKTVRILTFFTLTYLAAFTVLLKSVLAIHHTHDFRTLWL